jgi:ketosteroid isomerase-like protein
MTQVVIKLDSLAVATIRTATENMVKATLASDWDTWSQYLDDEAVMMPPNLEPIETRSRIRAFVEGFPKITMNRLNLIDVDGRGDLAYAQGRYEVTAGGVSDRGKVIKLWRKGVDGSWRLFRDIWNSDLPEKSA